jgi:hypothetical protein
VSKDSKGEQDQSSGEDDEVVEAKAHGLTREEIEAMAFAPGWEREEAADYGYSPDTLKETGQTEGVGTEPSGEGIATANC